MNHRGIQGYRPQFGTGVVWKLYMYERAFMYVVSTSIDWLFYNLCASVFRNLQLPSSYPLQTAAPCFCTLFRIRCTCDARSSVTTLPSLTHRVSNILDSYKAVSNIGNPDVSDPTLINQRNSSNASGKGSPLVMGRCRSSFSKGQGGMFTLVFNPMTQVQ
jgi:hypothetical protein